MTREEIMIEAVEQIEKTVFQLHSMKDDDGEPFDKHKYNRRNEDVALAEMWLNRIAEGLRFLAEDERKSAEEIESINDGPSVYPAALHRW